MTKSKPKSKSKTQTPSVTEIRDAAIGKMMSKAANAREKNKHLIQKVRKNPKLAGKVRELLCADLRRVFDIPRSLLGPSASRRRYRECGVYSEELVLYLIGSWAEFKRQAKIEESLGVRKVERNISKTLRAQQVAQYADEFVKPWNGAYDTLDMGQDMVTLMIGSDFHSKYLDPFGKRVWMEVLDMVQPDGIRYNGDGPDFPQLSRHRQLPGHFALSVQDEINVWTDFMRESREAAPNADAKWILGNHDIRLITAMADSAPVFASVESLRFHEQFKLDELETGLVARSSFLNPSGAMRKNDISQNWETLLDADGRPFWTTVHGFLCGKEAPSKHLAKFMTYGTNGHLHDPKSATGGSLATGALRWWQTGCMAYPPAVAAGYIPGPVESLGWAQSFLVVRLFPKTRHVAVEEITISDMAYFEGYKWDITAEEIIARETMMEI
jgi:hypothetical protein